jgi:hypothetical protein
MANDEWRSKVLRTDENGFGVWRSVREGRVVVGWISGRNVDVFDLATRGRNGETICFEAFQVKFNGFADERFSFLNRGPRGNAPW